MAYVNICLSSLCFSLRKDIINHKDILIILFFSNNICSYIMNVYSDSSHSALKYLKDTEVNINNLLIMTGDFNIRDRLWDSSFLHHSSISEDLLIITDSFDLELSTPTNPISTRYSDTIGESNSVIDLMFLCSGSWELNEHIIHSDWRLLSNHAPLTITISIAEEFIHFSKLKIPKNSEEEEIFVKEIINIFKALNTSSITNRELLEYTINSLVTRIEQAWLSNAKNVNITKHSKKWWNDNCNWSLRKYRESRNLEDWKLFKHMVKTTKRMFFDSKIQEIANKSHGPWELMNWVNKRKLPAMETIKHNGLPCLSLNSL